MTAGTPSPSPSENSPHSNYSHYKRPQNTSAWFEKMKNPGYTTEIPSPMDFAQWQRETKADLVNKSAHEIANELWKHGITADNPYITRWLVECWGFSRMTAGKIRRRIKSLSPLYLLAREAPDESEIEDG